MEELKKDIKNILFILLTPIILLIIGWILHLFSKDEISIVIINLFITVFLNLCFVFFIKYVLKRNLKNPKKICFLWSLLLLIIATINNGSAVNGGAFIIWYYINCNMLKIKENEKNVDNEKDIEKTNRYINQFTKIHCKVCDKEIPYNEYGTCEECHQKILKRLEEKNNTVTTSSEPVKENLKTVECKVCGKEIPYNDKNICNECETKLAEKLKEKEKRFCTKCGKEIKQEWEFCNYCGNKLK